MSNSDREQAPRNETERSSKRARGRRRSKQQEQGKQEAQAQQDTPASKQPPQVGKGGFDESGKVSSLLETTGEDVRQLLKAADDASKKIREAAQTETTDFPDQQAGTPGGDAGSLVGRINREVQQVLETADEAADKIRDEARAEARQVIAEARRRAESVTKQQMDRVSEMTDQVLGELSAVQSHLVRLQDAYDQAMRAMGADLGVEETRVWETKSNGEVEAQDEGEEQLRRRLGKRTPRKGAQEPEEISEGARLLALQQMMAGVDPKVIEGRLRNEFNVQDPKPILDWMGLHAGVGKPPSKPKKP